MEDFDLNLAETAIENLKVLITAGEAYPAFEKLVLEAKTRVSCSFRVFDLRTRLRSKEACDIGETWFDLILHKLNQNVQFDITITDFDPVVANQYHRQSWASARQLAAANELAETDALTFSIALHPARVGLLPRLVLSVKTRQEANDLEADAYSPGVDDHRERVTVPLVPATHHQKLAVIDGAHLFIGGLDINERRYDTATHDRPAPATWHDIHAIVRGPVVAAAERHIASFKAVVAGEAAAPPTEPGFLRTLSQKRGVAPLHISPKEEVTEIERAHLQAIAGTQGPILLETQFFRHKPIAEALADAANRNPSLTCMMVLPAAPEDVAFYGNRRQDAQVGAQMQMDCIDIITEAFEQRLALASPAQASSEVEGLDQPAILHDAPIIYVHSKLSLFGRREGIVSSANLNGRSMRWDTEAGIHLARSGHVSALWDAALGHWFPGMQYPDPFADQLTFISWLRAELAKNMVTQPEDRRHFLLPFPRGRDTELAEPAFGIPDEIV